MMSVKQFLRTLPLVFALWFVMPEASASHFMGVDISYQCLPNSNGCVFRIFHSTYYDCTGGATTQLPGPPAAPSLGTFTPAACIQPTLVGSWVFVSYTEVTPICGSAATQCTDPNATINGVLEARFYADYNFCNTNCNVYNIIWGSCCRNGSITSGASNGGIYTGNTQINLGLTPCNSSPMFSVPPVPYVCVGQNFTFNQGAFDPDGDSLVYLLTPCQDVASTPVGYSAGFSPTQPLGASWTVTLNPNTGDINLVPNPGNVVTAVLCVTVEEYRNGVKIGEVSRDIQVTVINCGANTPPTFTQLSNVVGGYQTGPYQITVCPNTPFSFNISGTDVDLNDSLMLLWNPVTAPAGATFTQAGTSTPYPVNGTVPNPPVGMMSWTPTISGTYNVTFTIQDNGCPLIASNQITVVIDVANGVLSPSITRKRTSCYESEFIISSGGGCPPYTVTFDPGDGTTPLVNQINTANWVVSHPYPAIPSPPATYNYSVNFVDFGGNTASVSGSVTVSNTAIANAGPDLFLCPGQAGQIGTPARPGHTYSWRGLTSNLGLPNGSGRSLAQPGVSLNNTTNSTISLRYEVTATDSIGCVSLDTVKVDFNPKPNPSFTASRAVCQGEIATVTYTGIRAPGTTYTWTWGAGTSTTGNAGVGPHSVFWNPPVSGFQTVLLRTTVKGCVSDAVTQLVEVKKIPTAVFNVISPICRGQASILTYNGSSSPGATGTWDLNGGTVVAGDPTGLDPLTVTWNTPGTKIIHLTVNDRDCISPVYTDTIIVYPIPSSAFSNPGSVCQGDTAQFVYLGNSPTTAAFAWDFDGGIPTPALLGRGPINVVWNTPGTKRICLNVQENGCFSSQTCVSVIVHQTPVAAIDPVSNVCFNNGANSVTFVKGSNTIGATYAWDFGDGSTPRVSANPSPAGVQYLSHGTKTASLVVQTNGCVSDTARVSFDVIKEPVSDFIINSRSTTCTHDTITLTLTKPSNGAGQTYLWNFGPNARPATSSLPNPGPVFYTAGGVKPISLVTTYRGCKDVKAQFIRVEESPYFSAGQEIDFCEGDGGEQLDATVTGGTPGYTYRWWCSAASCGLSSNVVQDPFVNPLAFAPQVIQYYGQAVDAKGCRSNIDTVGVTVHAKPKVDAGDDIVMCDDGIGVSLNGKLATDNKAPGPFSYQWADDQGNFPPNGMVPPNDKRLDPYTAPNQTTLYTLVITDISTGCDSRLTTVDPKSTVEVRVTPRPIANAGRDTVVCFGDNIKLIGYGSGGDGNYTYAWTPTNTGTISNPTVKDPTIGPQQTTVYTLVVKSEGCESSGDQVKVTVYTEPTADAGDDKDICLGDSIKLDGRVSGDPRDPAYSFRWVPEIGLNDPKSEKPNASPMSTQIYKLIATSDYGCGADTATVKVEVNPTPIVEITSLDTVICQGDEIRLKARHSFITTASGGPVVYLWTPASTVIDGIFDPAATVKPKVTTLYNVSTSIGNCSTSDQVLVTVVPGIEALINVSDTAICAGETTVLTASGGLGDAKYFWTPGLSLLDSLAAETPAAPQVSTTFTLRVEEGICVDDTSVTITVYPTPSSDYFTSQPEGCTGLEVNFQENTQDAVSYIWDFGDGSPLSNSKDPVYVYNTPGEYLTQLTAVGAFGCESTTQKAIIRISDGAVADFVSTPFTDQPIPLPNATVAFEDLSSNAVSWLWDFGDGATSTLANPTHTYRHPADADNPSVGYYVTLTVKDENGCVSSVAYGPYLVSIPDVFIPNVFSPNGDNINDEYLVNYSGSEDYSVVILDRWGRKVFESEVPGEAWVGLNPNGVEAPAGVYYYAVKVGEKVLKGNLTLVR